MRLSQFRYAVCLCVLFAAGCATMSPQVRVATFDRAVALYDQHHYAQAYKLFNAISTEDAAAARNVAFMLRKGQGVKRDPQAALAMYRFAAQSGLPSAEADLGEMLLTGEAGTPDPKAALPWLELAAQAHHAIAEYHLATMYEAGLVVKKNPGKARALYAASAASGYKKAGERLKAMGPPPALRTAPAGDTGGT